MGQWLRKRRVSGFAKVVAVGLGLAILVPGLTPSRHRAEAIGGNGYTRGFGFDRCVLPSTTTMQTWWDNSAYVYYGLYLGGVNFTCDTPASSSWISSVRSQGWRFAPLWVGQQSQCWTGTGSKFSNTSTTAYSRGTTEANSAAARARDRGFTNDTIIYLDLEGHTGSSACRTAAKQFVRGWVTEIHNENMRAGLYGSAGGSYLEDFSTISSPPDDIWAGRVCCSGDRHYSVYYLENYVSDAVWTGHQRLRQYEINTVKTFGGSAMSVDQDCSDGHITPGGTTSSYGPCYAATD